MSPICIRRDIRAAVARGQSLTGIESALLAGLPLSTEERDALWLYAWSLTWRRDRRRAGPDRR
jgi:hypothetical protein